MTTPSTGGLGVPDHDAALRLRSALAPVLGTDHVRLGVEADALQGRVPGLVVSPADTAQVAGVMAACHRAGAAVVVTGHGTRLDWADPPHRLDLLLDLSRMDAVLEHARGDLVLTAQPGLGLRALADALEGTGQHLVIDDLTPADGPGATIGGVIATGACGPRRMGVGAPRDLLIGLTIVRADGTVAKAGGKVVKNVAGYDLGKLLTGSLGTLGVVTEATFRLHPVPARQAWVEATVPAAGLAGALSAVVHSQLVPAALEVDGGGTGTVRVAVLLTGTDDGVEARLTPLTDLLGDPDPVVGTDPPAWATSYPGAADGTLMRATCVLSAVPALVEHATGLGVAVRGSAGVGVLHASLPRESTPEDVRDAVASLRGFCVAHGGSLVLLRAPVAAREAVDPWGPIGALALMRRIRHEFDPTGVLAPGRFLDADPGRLPHTTTTTKG